jgi:hypothetical protein
MLAAMFYVAFPKPPSAPRLIILSMGIFLLATEIISLDFNGPELQRHFRIGGDRTKNADSRSRTLIYSHVI